MAAPESPTVGVKAPGQRAQHTHRRSQGPGQRTVATDLGKGSCTKPETPWVKGKGPSLF